MMILATVALPMTPRMINGMGIPPSHPLAVSADFNMPSSFLTSSAASPKVAAALLVNSLYSSSSGRKRRCVRPYTLRDVSPLSIKATPALSSLSGVHPSIWKKILIHFFPKNDKQLLVHHLLDDGFDIFIPRTNWTVGPAIRDLMSLQPPDCRTPEGARQFQKA